MANTFDAKRTGDKFLPLPGPFALKPGELPRGGNFMRVTDIVPGDVTVEAAKLQPIVGTTSTGVARDLPIVANGNSIGVRPSVNPLKSKIVGGRATKKGLSRLGTLLTQ